MSNTILYILIILGVLTVTFYGLGLLFLGMAIWIVGTRMEKQYSNVSPVEEEDQLNDMETVIPSQPESQDETFKLDEYSENTLTNGR